jgi:hypothetical protein
MKRIMFRICLLMGLVMIVGLSGCQEITSASPDPNQIIEIRPGEKVVFEVEGPVNALFRRCNWVLYKKGVGYASAPVGTNKFEFQASPGGEPTNRITVEVWAQYLGIWSPGPADYSDAIFFVWYTGDYREWKIRVLQDTRPVWNGSYVIEDDADLHLLEGYTSITGDLYIYIDETTSLEGLESIATIGGNLYIMNINSLKNLSGLDNLTSVGGNMIISGNDDLTDLSGLESLTSVGGDSKIGNNDSLTSLGMAGLQKIGGNFIIFSNPLLCNSLAEGLRDQVLAREGIGGCKSIHDNKDCTTP